MFEDALDELLGQQLVIERGTEGQIFEVTKKGYALSDQMRIGTVPPPTSSIEAKAFSGPSLTPEASSLLAAVAKDAAGVLQRVKRAMGTVVRVSGKDFIPDDSPRTAATWSAAVDELVGNGYLESRGYSMTYHITKQGFTLQMRSPNHPQSAPPSPAPWTFAERMYGIAHCLIGRDGRVIEKCHQALTVPYTP